jgi:hypothetical protein
VGVLKGGICAGGGFSCWSSSPRACCSLTPKVGRAVLLGVSAGVGGGWVDEERAGSVRCTAQHSTAQHSTAQHSTAQHSTALHSTAQHSTAQHSTAQCSAAQNNRTNRPGKREEVMQTSGLAEADHKVAPMLGQQKPLAVIR